MHEYNQDYQARRSEMFDENGRPSQANKEKFEQFKEKWAGETLKDLGLHNVKKGRRDVNAVLKDIDPNYEFGKTDYSETELREFRERRKKLEHPTREKIKRGAKKAKEIADVVSSVRKAVSI